MHETAPKHETPNDYSIDLHEVFPNTESDVIRYVDRYLQTFVTTLKEVNPEYTIDLTRSALLRFLCKDDIRGKSSFQTTTHVQRRFAEILTRFPELRDNKVFQELGDVGSNDLDIKVWKNKPNLEYGLLSSDERDEEESTKREVGSIFRACAGLLGISADDTILYDEETGTYQRTVELVSDNPDERLFVTAVYGPKSTNHLVKGGQLLFKRRRPDGSTVNEFQLDMGFYSMPHLDMRSGPLASNKQQLSVPLKVVNGTLALDTSRQNIENLKNTVYAPDSFDIDQDIDRKNLPAEVERGLRAVRYSLLFSTLSLDGKTPRKWKDKLFTKLAWERLRAIFTETARAVKDGSFEFVDYNRHMLIKEVLVMLEIDLHLFLLVAAEINLFSIFPEWEGVSPEQIKSMITTRTALQFPQERNLRGKKAPSVWESRAVYKSTPLEQRPSALSIFANAQIHNMRSSDVISKEEIDSLYKVTPGGGEEGVFRLKNTVSKEDSPEALIHILTDYLDTVIHDRYQTVMKGAGNKADELEGLSNYSWMEIRRILEIIVGQIIQEKEFGRYLNYQDLTFILPRKNDIDYNHLSNTLLHLILDFSGITTGKNTNHPDRYQFSATSDIHQLDVSPQPDSESHQTQIREQLEDLLQKYYDNGVLKPTIDQYGSISILNKITPPAASVYLTSYACRISPPSADQIKIWLTEY